jgi:hypothetical protein
MRIGSQGSIGRGTIPIAGSFADGDTRLYDKPVRIGSIVRQRESARAIESMRDTMRNARTARRHTIALQRESEPDATDYFNATDYSTRADALEARYALLRHARLEVVATMAHEASNDGRASQAVHAASSVNAASTARANGNTARIRDSFDARTAEERVTVRPYSTASFLTDLDRQYSTPKAFTGADGKPVDTACYSIQPDGTRTLFTVPSEERDTARKPVRKQQSRKERTAAKHRAIAGTIRMGEQD